MSVMENTTAARLLKPLKGKKLDKLISLTYGHHAEGRTINVMDIGKVFAAARTAYGEALAAGGTPNDAARALDAAIVVAVERYTTPAGGGS